MTNEQVLLTIIAAVGAAWGFFKIIFPRFVTAKIKADEYERARAAFREDKTFDLLEGTLEHWKQSHAEERDETRDERAQVATLAKAVHEIALSVERNTQAANKIAASVDQHTDIIRLLVQQSAVTSDGIRDLNGKLGSSDIAAKTRPLRDPTE